MSETVMAGRSSDPTDNLKKRPAKGILKNSSSFEVEDGPSSSRKEARHNKAPKGTKWDEMNIIETLHPVGKDYGHMKIDEPKTPYERGIDETDALDASELAKKLKQDASKPLKSLARLEESSDDEDLTPEEKERKKAFESKRKAHYNEFLAAKKALKNLKDEDDEDDDKNPKPHSSDTKKYKK